MNFEIRKLTLFNIKDLVRKNEAIKLSPILDDASIFQIQEDIIIELSNGHIYLLQKGWEYDGATVPYIFQWIFPKYGIYSYNSLVHDLLYYTHYYDRKFSDKEHFIWGKALGIKKSDNYIRYYFLYLFGWTAWLQGKYNKSKRAKRNMSLTIRLK